MRFSALTFLTSAIFSKLSNAEVGDDEGGENCLKSCPAGEDEKKEEMGDHCYYWSTVTKTWEYSKYHCEGEGGHLAAVTSLEIHNFLMQKVNTETARYRTWFWIGGSEQGTEGIWEWEDGSEWEFTKWANKTIQQPNNDRPDHDFLQIHICTSAHLHICTSASNGWNDNQCSKHYQFICSWKICSGCEN